MSLAFTESTSRFKIISTYVTITIIGILLIVISAYKASSELEIIHEIDHMYSVYDALINKSIRSYNKKKSLSKENHLISLLSNSKYKVYSFTPGEIFKIDNFKFSVDDINQSSLNEYGGYISRQADVYTWSLVPYSNLNEKLLIIHKYHSNGMNNLLFAYKNKLIIPAIFIIWITVWGSLVLNNLIKQILVRKEEAEYLALHDPLTKLANRNLFTEKLNEVFQYSIRHQHSFCLAVIDLDKFKSINDLYGHAVGDELLKQVAARFKLILRNYDIVARLGGDEFVVLLPDTGRADGIKIYERIYSGLTDPYLLSGNRLSIGASLGISVFPEDSRDVNELVSLADRKMYIAKNNNGGIEVNTT